MQKNKSKSTIAITAAVLLLLAGIGGATYALMQAGTMSKDEQATTKPVVQTGPANPDYKAPDPLLPTIVFNDSGFTQKTYTFPAGTAIKVDNQSSMDLQFSSDDHPSHREHTELNMKVLAKGESGTFTPPGKGTYMFHDHINDQYEGTLVIQ